jgi:hypothetical protein
VQALQQDHHTIQDLAVQAVQAAVEQLLIQVHVLELQDQMEH